MNEVVTGQYWNDCSTNARSMSPQLCTAPLGRTLDNYQHRPTRTSSGASRAAESVSMVADGRKACGVVKGWRRERNDTGRPVKGADRQEVGRSRKFARTRKHRISKLLVQKIKFQTSPLPAHRGRCCWTQALRPWHTWLNQRGLLSSVSARSESTDRAKRPGGQSERLRTRSRVGRAT